MTVDKKDVITIPKWLVIWISPAIVSVIIGYGAYKTFSANIETTLTLQKDQIKQLQESKIERNEFNMILNQLRDINIKLDEHINNN